MARSAPAARGARNYGDPRAEYQRYYEALRAGNHSYAVTGFRNFVERFPGHDFADNAQYWLGEAYYVTRDYSTALGEFTRVVAEFPDSQKVPDALLKIGYVHYELKQWDQARETLSQVAARVPGTTVARLAEQRLQRMRQEGR